MNQVKWLQDQKNVFVQFYVGRQQKSQIELTIYDNFFQVYIKNSKNLTRVDFFDKVQLKQFTAFSLQNEWISFQVQKQQEGLWDKYQVELNKTQIRERRQEAIKSRDEFMQQQTEKRKQQKHEEIQKGQEQKFKYEDEHLQNKVKEKQRQKNIAFENIENQNSNIQSQKILLEQDKAKILNKVNDSEEYQIRSTNEITLEFTPKIYRNLAMREQYIFQPPPLKDSKKGDKGNFMWLHDKGNEFLRKKDYKSAMNAYDEVLKIEKDYLPTLANISLIHLKLTEFQMSYHFCEQFENIYKNSDENTQNLKQNKIMYQQIQKRKIFILISQGKIVQAFQMIQNIKVDDQENLKQDVKKIQQRIESNNKKKQADQFMSNGQYDVAKNQYLDILKEEPENEKALSNLSHIEMKQQNFKQALQYLNQILGQIYAYGYGFEIENKNESQLKDFIEKILMRKITCEEEMNDFDKMNETVQILLKINIENKYALEKRKKIYDEKKKQFKDLISEKKFTQALELFTQLEQLITLEYDPLEYLTLSLNKSVVYSYLKKFDQVIAECSKGLRVIKNLKQNTLNQKKKIFYQENEKEVQNIEIKYLLKRANAYLQTSQLMTGKKDLQNILQIDPLNKIAIDSLKKVQEVCQLNY